MGAEGDMNPMQFLNEMLGRPKTADQPFLLLVFDYLDETSRRPISGEDRSAKR